MKKLLTNFRTTIAIAIMLCVALPTFAHDFEVNGIYYNYLDETAKTVKVTYKGDSYYSYSNEYTGAVSIPSSVTYNSTTYSVTSIGSSAFEGCTGLTSVTIPNSVISIASSAFDNTGWYNNQPDGILYLDNCCLGYKGNGPTGTLSIKEGTRLIGDYAFSGCSGLTSVTIPNSVTSIGNSAIYGCSGLTSVTIPNSVTSIGKSAFYGCSGLTSVTIPNSVTTIGSSAFRECTGLTSVTIPNSVTSIGDWTFYGCAGLTSITIPNSVTTIGNWAFYGCSGLTSVTIPNSVTSIGKSAFYGCSGLTSVTIPNSVTTIGSSAFFKCTGLTSVNITDLSAWCKIDFGNSEANPLYYAKKLKLNGKEIKDLVIPNDITEIKDYAFYGCSGLTSVTIGNSVTSIGYNAFSYCHSLTSITIPNSVTSIGTSAFYNCTNLTSVTIGNSVTTIGSSAFRECTGLTSVTIPNSVTTIGSSAFRECTGLTSVTIPNSVTSIGTSAFYNCTNLTEVNISDLSAWCKIDFYDADSNPLNYAGHLYLNGSEVNDLVIPNDITKIKPYTFYGCTGLTLVSIGNSVATIGDYAFSNCTNLETFVSLNPTPPVCSSKSFYNSNYTEAVLYVHKDCFDVYNLDEIWGQFYRIWKTRTLATSITLNKTSLTLEKGETETINATVAPSNTTLTNLEWTCDNPSVAIVDKWKKITAVGDGTATITIRALDGSDVSTSCMVTVCDIETKVTLSQTEATLPVNDIMTLTYSVTYSPNKTATWSTSNANVAYVKTNSDGSATIVGVADGVATITATANDGSGASASCVVTVGVGGIEGVEMDNNAVEVARYDIHGRLLSEPARGINIIKMSDGTTRKEIVK